MRVGTCGCYPAPRFAQQQVSSLPPAAMQAPPCAIGGDLDQERSRPLGVGRGHARLRCAPALSVLSDKMIISSIRSAYNLANGNKADQACDLAGNDAGLSISENMACMLGYADAQGQPYRQYQRGSKRVHTAKGPATVQCLHPVRFRCAIDACTAAISTSLHPLHRQGRCLCTSRRSSVAHHPSLPCSAAASPAMSSQRPPASSASRAPQSCLPRCACWARGALVCCS